MKKIFTIIMLLLALPITLSAQSSINLTPVAKDITVGEGQLVLPQEFTIATGDLPDSIAVEATKFATEFAAVTGYTVNVAAQADDALFRLSMYTGTEELGEEGYTLDVTAEGVTISAPRSHGFFYAFQTVKKVLPACVMAGVKDEKVTEFALPLVSIVDAPRFAYRGFMLDVARHFFTVEEVKRMIDVMSYYKMNRFHWHLTEDQGWRVEIKKYPKLTTVGSIAPNSRFTDMVEGHYWINRPYGPYFYTQDELREVVAYAKEKHIEIIPEIDMPGHFVAALVAYPEYSCNPSANRSVWIDGGVSSDVLNVANPEAVQFAKDILTEIMDIFPYERIHIGGDECPTSAWENNAECRALKEELGLSSFRALQSRFIKQMSDHVVARGRKISVWNEAISNQGADTEMIKETDAIVYAWSPADASARQAANMGLKNVYTPYGPYYINRKQSTDANEPPGAGDGTDTVERTYNVSPVPSNVSGTVAKNYYGVQGTFWTEHVSDRKYMEYLALPRLIAVAEAGWSQQADKNFADFQKRITADTLLLDYNGYYYGRHYILGAESGEDSKVMPMESTAEKQYWYRLVTKATGDRLNKCLELLREGSPLISQYSGKNAAAGRLWTNAQAAEGDAAYDYQWWAFEKDPNGTGNYALVCKAQPNGSVNPNPTATSNTGRWNYDNDTKHYDFILADNGYGESGENYYYSIRSSKTTGVWMNASLGGQGFAANVYNNPADGNGGLWTFVPMTPIAAPDASLQERIESLQEILESARTYEGEEKVTGAFAKSAADALAALVNDTDLSAMTEEELAEFTASLNTAEEAFYASFGYMEQGSTYRFVNSVEGFEGITIAMKSGNKLQHADGTYINDAWVVTSSTVNEDRTQSVQLKNYVTGDFIGATATSKNDKLGYPVSVGASGTIVVCKFNPANGDYTLSIGGKNLYPVPNESLTLPGTISSGSSVDGKNATRLVGGAWNIEKVHVMTIETRNRANNALIGEGTYRRSIPAGSTFTYEAPAIKNFEIAAWEGLEGTAPVVESVTEDINAIALYNQVSSTVTTVCRDLSGAIISVTETECPVGGSYTVTYPELKYYTFSSAEVADGTAITPDENTVLEAFYSTEAYNGVKEIANAVTEVKDGYSYVIYDTSPSDAARIGYLNLNGSLQIMKNKSIENTNPVHTWMLEESGEGFKVKNEYYNLYVPRLTTAANPSTVVENGEVYRFILNDDGITWKIKGTNGICWDGVATGALVGWNDPGHPFMIYEYIVDPYFEVTVNCITEDETVLSTESSLVKAGSKYTLNAEVIDDYVIKEITGDAERLNEVDGNLVVNVVYASATGIGAIEADKAPQGIFDLRGRKLNGISSPGVYIVNGKKMLVTE